MYGMKLIVNNYFLWLSSRRKRMENLGLPDDGGGTRGDQKFICIEPREQTTWTLV
jgi:hypothetical protein